MILTHHLKELTLSYYKIIKLLKLDHPSKSYGRLKIINYEIDCFVQKMQAMFHERIIDLHELRVASEYFMVGYYGRGFPLFLRVSDGYTSKNYKL